MIVATYARPAQLTACLESLACLEYPVARFEVVVVDDGSPESLEPVTVVFQSRLPLRYVRRKNGGCGPGRNTGAANARGRYIAFTDDDCRHAPDWLSRLEGYFERDPGAMVGGLCVNALESNRFSAASQLLIDYLLYTANQASASGGYLNNMALLRREFLEMGGFDEGLWMSAEDRDLCDRWARMGKRIVFAPEIRIEHWHRLSWRSFWRQHYGYGRGAFHHRRNEKTVKPSWRFYRDLLLYPFTREPAVAASKSAALLGIAQCATFAGWWSQYRECK